jgi:hypothetical protein
VSAGAAVQLFIHHGNQFRYNRKLSGKESELMVRFLFVSIHRGSHLNIDWLLDQIVSLSATPVIMLVVVGMLRSAPYLGLAFGMQNVFCKDVTV